MHELAVCEAIADTVTGRAGGRTVRSVRLQIGHFRQIVPDTLQFYWEMHTGRSDLAGCDLEVDYIPVEIRCRDCAHTTTLTDPILLCGRCDGADVEMIRGEEFLIESIELVDVGPMTPPHR